MKLPKWLEILQTLGPTIIKSAFPQLAPITNLVISAAVAAESIPGATGEQKNAAAQQIAQIGSQITNATTGKPLVDPVVAAQITDQVFTTVVQAVNAINATKTNE